MSTSCTGATRQPFLDALRIAAFGVLVAYHVGMLYVSWDFHVKSPFAGPALEPWMKLSSPWRMSLLFFVSGAATAYMLARDAASGAWLRSRALRLLLPLAFGMIVVVPPQSYLEVVQKHGYAGDYVDFMRLYLAGHGGFCAAEGRCLVLPTWNHLWFLPYLMTYTAMLWLALRRFPRALDRAAAPLRAAPAAVLVVVPVLWLLATRLLLRPHFPVTHAWIDDPFAHAQYAAVFAAGAVAARAGIWSRLEAWRWWALVAAAVGYVGIVAPLPPAVRAIAASTMQWCAIVAAAGFAYRHLNRDFPGRRVLAEAVFPVYVLHQTVIIVAFAALARWQLAPMVEGPVLIVVTFAVCGACYAAVRRCGLLRPLVGLAPMRAQPPSSAGADTLHDTPKRSVTLP